MTFKIYNNIAGVHIATAKISKDNNYIAIGNTNMEALTNLFNKINYANIK